MLGGQFGWEFVGRGLQLPRLLGAVHARACAALRIHVWPTVGRVAALASTPAASPRCEPRLRGEGACCARPHVPTKAPRRWGGAHPPASRRLPAAAAPAPCALARAPPHPVERVRARTVDPEVCGLAGVQHKAPGPGVVHQVVPPRNHVARYPAQAAGHSAGTVGNDLRFLARHAAGVGGGRQPSAMSSEALVSVRGRTSPSTGTPFQQPARRHARKGRALAPQGGGGAESARCGRTRWRLAWTACPRAGGSCRAPSP